MGAVILVNKKIVAVVLIFTLLISLSIIGIKKVTSEINVDVKVAAPLLNNVSSEIMISGKLELMHEQVISYSSNLGSEYEYLVEEGQQVEKGTPIVHYINNQIQFEKEQLEVSIDSGYLRINQIEKQEEKLIKDKLQLEKKSNKEEAEKATQEEEQQLWYEKRMANLDLRKLLLQKEELLEKEDALIVKSKIQGVVLSINHKSVLPDVNEALIRIGSKEHLMIKGNLSEFDSIHVKEGQEVKISSDTVTDETWTGVVEEVSYFPTPHNEMDEGVTSQYPLSVVLNEGPTGQFKPGNQFILEIVTDVREALTIPMTSIVREDGVDTVYVVEGDFAIKKDVKLGVLHEEYIEIQKGISTDDQIIIDPPLDIYDGMEVNVSD